MGHARDLGAFHDERLQTQPPLQETRLDQEPVQKVSP